MKRFILSFLLSAGYFYLQAQVCPTISVSTTSVTCNGGNNGSATVAITNGTGPFSYTWSPSGGSSSSISNLSAGVYTVRVSDASTCAIVSATFSIIQPNFFIVAGSQTNAICWGGTGLASYTAVGGTPPYTYTWFPSGGNAPTATISAGNYTLIVKDFNSCTTSSSLILTEPPNIIAVPFVTNAICGSTSGGASVAISGGVSPFTYTWNPTGLNTPSVHLTTTGIYTVSVKDANGCTGTSTLNFLQTTQPTLVITSTNVKCNGANNGSATVTVNGGLSPYTYSWSSAVSSTAVASGLSPGTYTVSITDAATCSATSTVTITQPSSLTASFSQSTISCNGGTAGATITPSGGTAPYSYSWSPTGGNASTALLTAGFYTVTAKDANLCAVTQTFTLTQPTALTSTGSQTNIICNGASTGAAVINASGGTPPYAFGWTPSGSSSSLAINLSAGSYTATVIDAYLCILTATYLITQTPDMQASINTTSIICNGQSTGAATLNVTGGGGSYTYTWNPTGGNGPSASSLPANTYSVLVKDANNCLKTFTLAILQPAALSSTVQITNITCNNSNNGSATVNVNGGIAPYTYTWSPGSINTPSISSLSGGVYSVSIRDANLCTRTETVQLINPASYTISVSGSNILCGGQSTGSASVSVSGGVPAYNYTWSPSGITTSVATGLSAGDQTVTIKDANNCIVTRTLNISAPPALTVTASSSSATCSNPDGSATVTASGGTGSYTYSWIPTGGTNAAATAITAGQYTAIVTDQNSCQQQIIVIVGAISPSLTISASNPTVCSGGTTTLTASGTSSYTWSPSAGLSSTSGSMVIASPTAATIYSVTGNFGGACLVTTTISVQLYPSNVPVLSFTAGNLCSGNSATLHASGGISYTWSPSAGLSNAFISDPNFTLNNPTTYTAIAIDNLGCLASQTIAVNPLPVPVLTVSGNTLICLGSSASLTLSGAASYTWSPGLTTNTILVTPDQNTLYTVNATGTNNCVGTTSITITVNPLPSVSIQSGTVLCKGNTATLTASGASTYSWNTGASVASITDSPSSSTIYTVLGTDAFGCSNIANFSLTVFSAPTLSISGKKDVCSNDKVTLTASGANSYTWSSGEVTTSIAYVFSSSTVITVSSGLGNCAPGTASISINVNTSPSLALTYTTASIKLGQSFTMSAASDATLFAWTPSVGLNCNNCLNPIAQPSVPTTYTIEVSRKGCKTTGIVVIDVDNFCGEIFAPTAFSPNEDANNDTWCIYGSCIQTIECEIYNRWGQKVHSFTESSACWDGKLDGVLQNTGIFVYQAKIGLRNGDTKTIKGNFTLVR